LPGTRADDEKLVRARECLFRLGGIHKIIPTANFTGAFRLYDWAGVRLMVPELVFFPNCFISTFTRCPPDARHCHPLSIVWAKRPKIRAGQWPDR